MDPLSCATGPGRALELTNINHKTTINDLPRELLWKIFSYLSQDDLMQAQYVNETWKENVIIHTKTKTKASLKELFDKLNQSFEIDGLCDWTANIESADSLAEIDQLLKKTMKFLGKHFAKIPRDEDFLVRLKNIHKSTKKCNLSKILFESTIIEAFSNGFPNIFNLRTAISFAFDLKSKSSRNLLLFYISKKYERNFEIEKAKNIFNRISSIFFEKLRPFSYKDQKKTRCVGHSICKEMQYISDTLYDYPYYDDPYMEEFFPIPLVYLDIY